MKEEEEEQQKLLQTKEREFLRLAFKNRQVKIDNLI